MACLGNMGSDVAADCTALSDAVNLASRLESATKQIGCDLAVGHKTYESLARDVALAALFTSHTVELKGYRQPMVVYAASLGGLRTLLGLQQPLLPFFLGSLLEQQLDERASPKTIHRGSGRFATGS